MAQQVCYSPMSCVTVLGHSLIPEVMYTWYLSPITGLRYDSFSLLVPVHHGILARSDDVPEIEVVLCGFHGYVDDI